MTSTLASARYGKDLVRVLRVVREEGKQTVVEYSVRALLEGDLDISYTQADNSVIVATDSIKNTIYALAKTSKVVLCPDAFAIEIATHFVTKYKHIHKAYVDIEQLRWTRIVLGDGPNAQAHKHSFFRDGDEKRIVKAEADATLGKDKITLKVTAGLKDLLVLKSSGSAFEGFIRDEYTTLVEVNDRILSTAIDLEYVYDSSGLKGMMMEDFDRVATNARRSTLELFSLDESASVQATLFKMGQKIIEENASVASVSYALPNKHFIPVNLSFIGLDNTAPSDAEVFCPISAPSGLIAATIVRS